MFATLFDPLTSGILLSGFGLIALSLLILLGVVLLRLKQNVREKWISNREEFWRSWLDDVLVREGLPDSLPHENWNDFNIFLSEWINRFRNDSNHPKLRTLASRFDLPKKLMDRLKRGSFSVRLLSMTVLGFLKWKEAWCVFRSGLRSKNPVMVLVALRAMLHTQTRRALGEVFDRIREKNLPIIRTRFLLSDVNTDLIGKVLVGKMAHSSSDEKVNLIPYLKLAPTDEVREWLIDELRTARHSEVLARGINVLGTIGERKNADVIKSFLDHETWFIRVRAVHALGDLNVREDGIYLRMLSDTCWWVRRAAAIHLVRSAGEDSETLNYYLDEMQDDYARDQLIDTMSEELEWNP